MKKLKSLFLMMIASALFCAVLFGCGTEPEFYTLSYYAADGGTIAGEPAEFQWIYNKGENGTEVTATPNKGYIFVEWSDGEKNATRQETNVRSDLTFTAKFERETYSLSYGANANGSITGETTQSVEFDDSGSIITAVPNEGYIFAGWSDGRLTNPRQDKRVSQNFDAKAGFTRNIKTFEYVYNNATGNKDTQSITFHYDTMSPITLAIPEKENYIFEGWYLEPEFITRVTDGDGRLYLGHGVFYTESDKLYAKWTKANESKGMTFKILMVFVDEVHATLETVQGERIAVDYKMSLVERKTCELIPSQISKTLNEWFDGLITFEVDTYFTTVPLGKDAFSSGMNSDGTLEYDIKADKILEVCPILKYYRSITTTYGMNDYDYILHDSGGNATIKYATIYIESIFGSFIKNDMPLESYLDLSYFEWEFVLEHFLHEFTHTAEMHYGYGNIYEYHDVEVYYSYKHMWGLEVTRLYLFKQAEIDGEKVGIPYTYWIGEIDVTVNYTTNSINGWSAGEVNGKEAFVKDIPYGTDAEEVTAVPNEGYRFVRWSDGVMTASRRDTNVISFLIVTAIFEPI